MDLLKNIFKGDKVIWIIFLCLCLISIIEVVSSASTLTYKSGDHWGPITQHSVILMVGAVVVVILHNIPYKWFQVFPVFLYPISLVLLAFGSCQSLEQISIDYMQPGDMTFPSQLRKVAIVNNTSTEPDNKLITQTEKPKENVPEISHATAYANGNVKIAAESLAEEIVH